MEGLGKHDKEYVGDFDTPEQDIPATGLPGVDWETCMTMNDTWGFRTDDKNWKSTEDAHPPAHRQLRRRAATTC